MVEGSDERDELSDTQMDGVSGGAWNPFKKESWEQLGSDIQQVFQPAADQAGDRLKQAGDRFTGTGDDLSGKVASGTFTFAGLFKAPSRRP